MRPVDALAALKDPLPSPALIYPWEAYLGLAGPANRFEPLPCFPPTRQTPSARGAGCWRICPDGTPHGGVTAAIAVVRQCWNGERGELVDLAERWLPRVPGMLLCSDTLKTDHPSSSVQPMERVLVTHRWIAFNKPEAFNCIFVDIDHGNWKNRLDTLVAAGLPPPAYLCHTTKGVHLTWILGSPVVIRSGSIRNSYKPFKLLSVMHASLIKALDGDAAVSLAGMTRNPWHHASRTEIFEVRAHELHDLFRPLKAIAEKEGWRLPPRWVSATDSVDAPPGTRLFNDARRRVWVESITDRDMIVAIVEQEALRLGSPATPKARDGMARRIHQYVSRRDAGRRRHAPLSRDAIRSRQSQAGYSSAAKRRTKTDDKLAKAMAALRRHGKRPLQTEVAQLAGVSLSTVQRAWKSLINPTVTPAPRTPLIPSPVDHELGQQPNPSYALAPSGSRSLVTVSTTLPALPSVLSSLLSSPLKTSSHGIGLSGES